MTTLKLLEAKRPLRLAACAPVPLEMEPLSPTGVAPALPLAFRPTLQSMKARPPWLRRVLRVAESNVASLGKHKIPSHAVPQIAQSAPRFSLAKRMECQVEKVRTSCVGFDLFLLSS
jgi:hypothetical protein